jgi:hypothetical protein
MSRSPILNVQRKKIGRILRGKTHRGKSIHTAEQASIKLQHSSWIPDIQSLCTACENKTQREILEISENKDSILANRRFNQQTKHKDDIESGIYSIKQRGKPLSRPMRDFFEPRFGVSFGDVKIHTDAHAAHLARSINANAFTVDNNIVFGAGRYVPVTHAGRRLLAHELTHIVQQGSRGSTKKLSNKSADVSLCGSTRVQRDLSAYNKPKQQIIPCYAMFCPSTYITISAEAPGLRSSLSALISSSKVKEVKSKSGNKSWFAANHHRNCKRSDIGRAFRIAGYSLARKMARALYDIHGEYLYHKDKIVVPGLLGGFKKTKGPRLTTQRSRSLTEFEIRQAKIVFKNALNYSKVTIEDGSPSARIMSLGGYARTVGNTIYFPVGKSRDMPFMIHELTHVWQYQKKGIVSTIKCLWAQATTGYKYMPKGTKNPDQYMLRQRGRGKTLYSYNYEQQGDILEDYYRRRRKGLPVIGYRLFAKDVK